MIICANVLYFFTKTAVHYAVPFTAVWTVLVAVGLFILGNILHNYSVCISYNPGYTRGMRSASQMYSVLGDGMTRSVALQPAHEMRWCEPCNAPKPKRVHHCSVCDACVMKMVRALMLWPAGMEAPDAYIVPHPFSLPPCRTITAHG